MQPSPISRVEPAASRLPGREFPRPGQYADWAYQGLTIAAMLLLLAGLCW